MTTRTPSQPTQWQILDTVGPVFSNSGMKNWDLCLVRDAIIAFPRSFWLTIKAGLFAGLKNPAAMQRSWAKSADAYGERVLQDEGSPKWRRYLIKDLESITVKKCLMSANEIRIQREGAKKSDVYGLGDRSQTDECRRLLREFYGDLYGEEKF